MTLTEDAAASTEAAIGSRPARRPAAADAPQTSERGGLVPRS